MYLARRTWQGSGGKWDIIPTLKDLRGLKPINHLLTKLPLLEVRVEELCCSKNDVSFTISMKRVNGLREDSQRIAHLIFLLASHSQVINRKSSLLSSGVLKIAHLKLFLIRILTLFLKTYLLLFIKIYILKI